MKITIIGGGNIGTLMAGELASIGHEVTVFTSKPEKWNTKVKVLDAADTVLMTGNIAKATSDLEEAICDADLIWVTYPAQLFSDLNQKLKGYIQPEQLLGVVPGSGGAEFAFHDVIEQGVTLFGLQRVHSIARIEKYGDSVHMLGRKERLEVGSVPADASTEIAPVIEDLFDIPCIPLPNYLCVTLTPSNPILHTTRLYTMFKDYHEGTIYPRNYLFYEEWTDESSTMLLSCDQELQNLCEKIPLDLNAVVSLRDYYESYTPEEMTRRISRIPAFKGLTSPMKRQDDGWVPDFSSRYFTSDFQYGLKIIKDLAQIYSVGTTDINTVWQWYKEVALINDTSGINLRNKSRMDIESTYH